MRALGGMLSVAPATLDFGDVALGREQTRRITVRNTGLVSMTVAHLDQFQRIVISPCSVSAILYSDTGPAVLTVNSAGDLTTMKVS